MSNENTTAEVDLKKISSDYAGRAKDAGRAASQAGKGSSDKSGRLLFIDGLRGVAALAVMLFHFYTPLVSPLYDHLHQSMPGIFDLILLNGYVGVEVFFVLSGFVIAYTLRNDDCSPRFAGNFILRRCIRLDPPYWTIIFLSVYYRCILWHHYSGEIFRYIGWRNLLANMFYLADQNHRPLYVGVAWTLCLEVRFYLSFIGMLVFSWLAGSLIVPAARKWTLIAIFVPLTAYSIYWRYATGELTFIGTWYMFAMGATLAWTITKRIRERWLWVVVAAAVGGELWQPDFRGTVAILAVLAIYAAAKTGKMGTWLSWSPIQNLGKISYSLYLCHVPVGLAVMSILQANGDDSHFLALASFTLASVVSIIVAQTLQKCVEGPCIKLAKRLKLKDPPGKKAIVAVPAPVSGPSMGLNLATG